MTFDLPLTVTIDRAATQSDPASTAPVHFTVVFSEPMVRQTWRPPVPTFGIPDVSLAGTAPGAHRDRGQPGPYEDDWGGQ